ncbi:hypothetical protein [Burkholderia sp. BCC1999]|uniref:hypothetical protein n=1 Tax=Burkholderia sp. BCC1999 TaxID=2817448 RepID=UPI002AC34495|nr:hypothetical protein [Burkholderia sp. BCC1999]
MTDTHEQGISPLKPAASRQPLWVAILWTVLGLSTLAYVFLLGYLTVYCGSLGEALFWALLWPVTTAIHDSAPYALNLWTGLGACAAIVLIARLLQRFKVTWIAFLVTLTSVYFVAAIIARLINAQGNCGLF